MKAWGARILAIAAGALTLWLLNLVLNPVPVAAGPAFGLGALCLLVPALDSRQHVLNLATVAGAFIGAWIHRGWHQSGQSPPPAEGLVQHVFFEGLMGLLAAMLCLAVAVLLHRKLRGKAESLPVN